MAAAVVQPVLAPKPAAGVARRPEPGAPQFGKITVIQVAIGMFILVAIVLLAGVGGRLAAPVYVAAAILTAGILITRRPATYVAFALWLWFVTPWVRRVLDLRHGWNPTNPILLAPPLVGMLGVFLLSRYARELKGILFTPFLLALAGLAYGYSVGVITASLLAATYSLLTWLAPVVFGMFIAASWRRYPDLVHSVRRAFGIALPVLAAYGIYQFLRMPVWDAAWMRNADMRSLGPPLPLLARTFGTLNAPGPYAAFLATGMLIALPQKGWFRYASIAAATISLLLTRTRAVWIAFLIGLIVAQLSQPILRLPKRTLTVIAIAVLVLPFAATSQFKDTILPRLSTLTHLREDNSFIKRVEFSQETASGIVETAEGNGLGTTGGAIKLRDNQGLRSLDNGFLEVYYVLGWPGGTLFFLAIATLIVQAFRFGEPRKDTFANSARASTIALISVLPIGDVFTGPTGTLLWAMVGFGIAAHTYHRAVGREAHIQTLYQQLRGQPGAASAAGIPVTPVPVHR